jgi:hypothetical protein
MHSGTIISSRDESDRRTETDLSNSEIRGHYFDFLASRLGSPTRTPGSHRNSIPPLRRERSHHGDMSFLKFAASNLNFNHGLPTREDLENNWLAQIVACSDFLTRDDQAYYEDQVCPLSPVILFSSSTDISTQMYSRIVDKFFKRRQRQKENPDCPPPQNRKRFEKKVLGPSKLSKYFCPDAPVTVIVKRRHFSSTKSKARVSQTAASGTSIHPRKSSGGFCIDINAENAIEIKTKRRHKEDDSKGLTSPPRNGKNPSQNGRTAERMSPRKGAWNRRTTQALLHKTAGRLSQARGLPQLRYWATSEQSGPWTPFSKFFASWNPVSMQHRPHYYTLMPRNILTYPHLSYMKSKPLKFPASDLSYNRRLENAVSAL